MGGCFREVYLFQMTINSELFVYLKKIQNDLGTTLEQFHRKKDQHKSFNNNPSLLGNLNYIVLPKYMLPKRNSFDG